MKDYRLSHRDPDHAGRYDRTILDGYYGRLFATREVPKLVEWLKQEQPSNVLDFACGTGRITALLAGLVDRVEGVDVSQAMLSRARERTPTTELHCEDITAEGSHGILKGPYQCVTAFRFFQNAQPELRHKALAALRQRMEPGGTIIINVQCQARSLAGVAYRLRSAVRGDPGQQIRYEDAEELLQSHGFNIEEVFWYGYVPRLGRYTPKWWSKLDKPMEKLTRRAGVEDSRVAEMFMIRASLGLSGSSSE